MENYIPADETVEEPANPFPSPYNSDDVKTMLVGKSSKFNKINGNAKEFFAAHPDRNRFVVFKSMKGATERAISCVEVFKQQFKEPLYQWTKIVCAKKIVIWKPLEPGPRDIRVTIDVPVVFIVLSLDPFPGDYSCMSMQCSSDTENAFVPTRSAAQIPGKTVRNKERKGNRKTHEGNKWTKPGPDQRKKDHKERDELLKDIEKK